METIYFRDLGKVTCKIVEGKEALFDEDGNTIDERNTYVVDYRRDKTLIENWKLRCKCKYRPPTYDSWGKDSRGLDILICTQCFRRFSQCSFCLEEEDAPRRKSKSDGGYSFSCWRCWLPEEKKREKLKLQFEENKVMRETLRKEGEISALEEKTKNLIDELMCESYKVLIVSKSKNKVVFYRFSR